MRAPFAEMRAPFAEMRAPFAEMPMRRAGNTRRRNWQHQTPEPATRHRSRQPDTGAGNPDTQMPTTRHRSRRPVATRHPERATRHAGADMLCADMLGDAPACCDLWGTKRKARAP